MKELKYINPLALKRGDQDVNLMGMMAECKCGARHVDANSAAILVELGYIREAM